MGSLAAFGIACVRARNPGPLTLTGTNSWVLGRDRAWVIDPGPALEDHLDALAAELDARGGAGGIALTHGHADHADGVAGLLERVGAAVPVAAAASGDVRLADGDFFGPLRVIALPGHASDHLGFVLAAEAGLAAFTGDAVLGAGSVFVAADMAGYLEALRRLRALEPALLCPGHGPAVWEPAAHLDAYVAHRLERERALLVALDGGLREESELLEVVWADVPTARRPAAALTLRAHLEKLRAEGRYLG